MGEISFTKESLVDGVSPCGTSVFQRYENAIDQLCHDASRVTAGTILDADTVSGAGITAGKHVWTTTSAAGDDGNGGQPPAPKPSASAGAGYFVYGVNCTWSGGFTLAPAGGQWVFVYQLGGNWYVTFVAGGGQISNNDVRATVWGWRTAQ